MSGCDFTRAGPNLFTSDPEEGTRRIFLDVIARLDNLQPAECLAQEQSPLFSTIPAEIRDLIFSYYLAEQNGKKENTKEMFFYRPDYTHFKYIDTALLRTCRRIYLETRTIPVQNVTYRDYLGSRARKPFRLTIQDRLLHSDYHNLHCAINPAFAELSRPERMQVFAQMHALQNQYQVENALNKIRYQKPNQVTFTVRHTDWQDWEGDEPLQMNNVILPHQKWPKCIETFELELETRNGKKAMLDDIVKEISKWMLQVEDVEKEILEWPGRQLQPMLMDAIARMNRDMDPQTVIALPPHSPESDGIDERDDYEPDDDMSWDEEGAEGAESEGSEENEEDDWQEDELVDEILHDADPQNEEDQLAETEEQSPLIDSVAPNIVVSPDEDAQWNITGFRSEQSQSHGPTKDEDSDSEISDDEEDDAERFILVSTGNPVVSTWIGSQKISGIGYTHHQQEFNDTTTLGRDEMMYYVVKLAWEKMSVAQYEQEWKEKRELRKRATLIM